MKKVVVVIVLTLVSIGGLFSQDQSIGLRLGYGAELSYQHPLGGNRLEFGLGLSDFAGSLNLAGTYQVMNKIGVFKWYIGGGAGVLLAESVFGLAGLGQLGIEYNFDFPLQLSADWRPGISIVPAVKPWLWSAGLGVRYKF